MEEDPLAMPPSTAAALVVHASYLSAKIKVRALCLPTLPSARARASTPLLPCPPTPSDGHTNAYAGIHTLGLISYRQQRHVD